MKEDLNSISLRSDITLKITEAFMLLEILKRVKSYFMFQDTKSSL